MQSGLDIESKAEVVLKADEDHIHCPITQQVMRHPVLASDGRHYELTALLNWVKRKGLESPISREPLTSVLYDLGLQASLEKSFADDDRHANYNRTADMHELGALIQQQQFLQLRQLDAFQEEKLQMIEQVQARRHAAVLQQIRWRALAVPVRDVRMDINARPEGQPEDIEVEGVDFDAIDVNADNVQMRRIWQNRHEFIHADHVDHVDHVNLLRHLPMKEFGRFFCIYMLVSLTLYSGYELVHSGSHDSSQDHLQDVIDHAAPAGMLVATADVAVRYISQNAHGFFSRMRGAVSNYFGGWVRPAAREEDNDMGEYHVRPHIL